jgi:hypothetical protein
VGADVGMGNAAGAIGGLLVVVLGCVAGGWGCFEGLDAGQVGVMATVVALLLLGVVALGGVESERKREIVAVVGMTDGTGVGGSRGGFGGVGVRDGVVLIVGVVVGVAYLDYCGLRCDCKMIGLWRSS